MKKKTKIEIDTLRILRIVARDKIKIIVFCILGAILGLAVGIGTPRTYTTGVRLAPESSTSSGLKTSLSSIASMVGMDMNFGNTNDAIVPELYPDVMESNDFLVSLFDVKVSTLDGSKSTTYYDYLLHHQKSAWYEWPLYWISQLARLISNSPDIKPASSGVGDAEEKVSPFFLTKEQDDVAKMISRRVTCSVDRKTDVISIEVKDQDPYVAALVADSVKEHLQSFITDYRTKKARNDVAFAERLYEDMKAQYVEARQRYTSYSDANQELILESYKAKQEDLENDMQLKYTAYTQAVEQLQISRAKLQESIPVFSVIQSASVPLKHSSKGKVSYMITYIFLAFFLRVVILAWKHRSEIISLSESEQS
mgnify:CR=1 FL=1